MPDEELPLEIRAALAFSLPLRDGIELVRANGLGAMIVLGCDGCHDVIGAHDPADEPVTSERIFRAARNDGATVLNSGLTRIIAMHAALFPSRSEPSEGRGLRDIVGRKVAEQTGHPVVVVSKSRATVTLFYNGAGHELLPLPVLHEMISDEMHALRAIDRLREVKEELPPQSREDAYESLRRLSGLLVERGRAGVAVQRECVATATLLDVAWTPPRDVWERPPEPRKDRSDEVTSQVHRLSERLAEELDVAGSREVDGDYRLGAGLYVRRTRQSVVVDMLSSSKYQKPVLVHGAPGEGKSSLLWGLYQELRHDASWVLYLLNSIWLTGDQHTDAAVSLDDLLACANRAKSELRTPVFLIDTVDLLLHDRSRRGQVIDLCSALESAGGRVVLTSRTEEARLLPASSFSSVGLGSYDDAELPLAVEKHAAAFCLGYSGGDLEEKVATIVASAARGLPLREVAVNPLHLRLLFELYHPHFPPPEHDVSTLYSTYWKRRVHSDLRGETDDAAGEDLRTATENIGIALFASGGTELDDRALYRSVGHVVKGRNSGGHADEGAIERAVDILVRRGVLVRSQRTIRFFHQTMFEYAAAIGLLNRDQDAALHFFADHMAKHPDDLYVGAVAEQALALALDDPLLTLTAVAVLARMACGRLALQRIALGVLAHKPALQEVVNALVDDADENALRRYVQVVPTVLSAKVADQADMLRRAWQRECVRESVLLSLERLSARDQAPVLSVLRGIDFVPAALNWRGSPARMVKLAARVVVAVAETDPAWAWEKFSALLDGTLGDSVARTLPVHLLGVLAENWAVLGSASVGGAVVGRVLREQEQHDAGRGEMRQATGRIIALVWRDVAADGVLMQETIAAVVERLRQDHHDFLANAQLHAIANLIGWGEFDPVRAAWIVGQLTAVPGPGAFALSNSLFARLFAERAPGDPVLACVLTLLGGLPAPGNGPPEGPRRLAHVVRQALHHSGLSPKRLTELLSGLWIGSQVSHWFDDEYLAVLLVPCALGGHPIAALALERVRSDMTLLSETGVKNLGYELARHVRDKPELVSLLVEQSVHRKSAAPLAEVVGELTDSGFAALRACSSRLVDLVDALFDGGGAVQRDGANLWRVLHQARAVPLPEHDQLMSRFRNTPAQAARGNLLELAVDIACAHPSRLGVTDRVLRDLFLIDATGAVVSPRTGRPDHVAGIARTAWLRLECRGRSAVDVDVVNALEVVEASPASSDNFALVGFLISRLSRQGATRQAFDVVRELAMSVHRAQLRPKQENRLANQLRTPIREVVRSAPLSLQRELLRLVPDLPQTCARMVVAAAAQENFVALRADLAALLGCDVPPGVTQQIQDDMRTRSRTFAVGPLPAVINPLGRNGRPVGE